MVPRQVILQSGTVYQLLAFMESDGWHWERLPSARGRRKSLCYRDGDAKVWYTGGHIVVRSYLQALLSAGSIAAEWGIHEIPHGRTAEVYEGLLRGEVVPVRPPRRQVRAQDVEALEADTEVAFALNTSALPAPLMLPAPDVEVCDASESGGEDGGPAVWRPTDELDDFDNSFFDARDVGLTGAAFDEGTTSANIVGAAPSLSDAPVGGEAGAPDEHLPPSAATSSGNRGEPLPASAHDACSDVGSIAPAGRPQGAGGRALAPFAFERRWGCFRFTNFRSGRHGAIEAQCPFHALNDRSGCKKRCVIPGPTEEDFERTLLRLRWWCVQATDHQRQFEHVYLADMDSPPSADNIEALCQQEPPAHVVTDQEFYGLSVERTTNRGRAKAKAAAQGVAAEKAAAKKSKSSAANRRPSPEVAGRAGAAVDVAAQPPGADRSNPAPSPSSSSSSSSSGSGSSASNRPSNSPSSSSESGSSKSDAADSSD